MISYSMLMLSFLCYIVFFFFKQKPAYEVRISDWSSDVCSSDLAADRARANAGPTLIEHFTYRVEGHSTSDDPGAYRSADEASHWPLGDPIARLRKHCIALGIWDEERHAALARDLAEMVRDEARQAEKNGILRHGQQNTM